jgi:hypothetical protein
MKLEDDHRIYEIRDPEFWGPQFWRFLYMTVLGFPVSLTPTHSAELINLIKKFHIFVPCIHCRHHYAMTIHKLLKTTDTFKDVKTKKGALELVIKIHNEVRIRQGKNRIDASGIIKYLYDDYRYHTLKSRVADKTIIICIVIVTIMVLWKRST